VERLAKPCTGKLLAIWGLYTLAILLVSQAVDAAGYPPVVAWIAALGIAALVLLRTEL
jgi:hypothetical protein